MAVTRRRSPDDLRQLAPKARHCLAWLATWPGWTSAITMAAEYEGGELRREEDRHVIRGRRGRLVRLGLVEVQVRREEGRRGQARQVWYYRVTEDGLRALRGLGYGPPQLQLLSPRPRPRRAA